MRRWVLALALGVTLSAQQQQPPPKEEEPPEEDTSLKPKEYAFNPLQASKELRIGEYYFKKKSYRAAANRFREATHWNPSFADAYVRLGDAEEKLNDRKAAQEAYSKYLELNPGAKDADSIKKKLTQK